MLSIMTSFNGEATSKHLDSTMLKDSFLGTAHQNLTGVFMAKPNPDEIENESGAFQGGGEIE